MSNPDDPTFFAPRHWQTEEVAVQKLAARARTIAASTNFTPCSARSRRTRSFLRYVQPVRQPNLPVGDMNLAAGRPRAARAVQGRGVTSGTASARVRRPI